MSRLPVLALPLVADGIFVLYEKIRHKYLEGNDAKPEFEQDARLDDGSHNHLE